MKQEILTKLRTAEEETARRLEQAKHRAAEIAAEGRRKADETRRQAQQDARRDQEEQLRQERERLVHERDRILAEGRQREEKLRAHYRANVDAQVKKALELFARSLDA